MLRSFGDAMQADPAGIVAVEEMIRFATAAGRVSAADGGFQELVRRRREDPAVLVRYGDFLAGPGGNPDGALARYAQALIWRPDDTATRLKMAEIHLAAASAPAGEAAVRRRRGPPARRAPVRGGPGFPAGRPPARARGPAPGHPRALARLRAAGPLQLAGCGRRRCRRRRRGRSPAAFPGESYCVRTWPPSSSRAAVTPPVGVSTRWGSNTRTRCGSSTGGQLTGTPWATPVQTCEPGSGVEVDLLARPHPAAEEDDQVVAGAGVALAQPLGWRYSILTLATAGAGTADGPSSGSGWKSQPTEAAARASSAQDDSACLAAPSTR